ncbi:MAG TPA: hypothetical protein VN379_20130 [Sporomusa sp.]|nr:hypothetical protein [Sporomusa sp.]
MTKAGINTAGHHKAGTAILLMWHDKNGGEIACAACPCVPDKRRIPREVAAILPRVINVCKI